MTTQEKWFPRAEGMIWRYYKDMRRVENMQIRIETLEKRLAEIPLDISAARSVRSMSQALSFAPGGGQLYGLDNEIERMEEQVGRLMGEYSRKRRDVLELRARIDRIRQEHVIVDAAIQSLPRDERRVAELKYGRGWSNYQIASEVFFSEFWVRTARQRIVRAVAERVGLVGTEEYRKTIAQDT